MINFKEELEKYQPMLELDSLESSIRSSEIQDILDILQHISKNTTNAYRNNEA
ncbi:MAG: hypothetical protein GX299_03170 [Epulopiscium sp.]|nr:hypothetical protein [Candidatus Epulonipiscium sp.]